MPPIDLHREYEAYACGCGHLWLEAPRHVICADCGHRIGSIRLMDARAVAFYRHERALALRTEEGS